MKWKWNGKWYWQRLFGVIGRMCLHSSPYVWMLRKKNFICPTRILFVTVVWSFSFVYWKSVRALSQFHRYAKAFHFDFDTNAIVKHMYATSIIFNLDSMLNLVSCLFIFFIQLDCRLLFGILILYYHKYTHTNNDKPIFSTDFHIIYFFSSVFNYTRDKFMIIGERGNELLKLTGKNCFFLLNNEIWKH